MTDEVSTGLRLLTCLMCTPATLGLILGFRLGIYMAQRGGWPGIIPDRVKQWWRRG